MRRELFAHHLPNPDRVTADYAVLAELSKGLSGGDILNICLNAIYKGSVNPNPERCAVTQVMIETEIAKARKKRRSTRERRRGRSGGLGFVKGDEMQVMDFSRMRSA